MHLRQRQSGFSLMEVLVAMGVFTLGFVAVAAIFPSALLLQKRTIDQENATTFATSTATFLGAIYDNTTIDTTYNGLIASGRFGELTDADFGAIALADRAMLSDHYPSPEFADYFFIPILGRDGTGTQWSVYTLIVKRNPTVTDYTGNPDAIYTGPSSDPAVVPRIAKGVVSTVGSSPSTLITIAGATSNDIGVGDLIFTNGQLVTVLESDGGTFTLTEAVPQDLVTPINAYYFPREAPKRRSGLIAVGTAALN